MHVKKRYFILSENSTSTCGVGCDQSAEYLSVHSLHWDNLALVSEAGWGGGAVCVWVWVGGGSQVPGRVYYLFFCNPTIVQMYQGEVIVSYL